jgi:hypothetical protein
MSNSSTPIITLAKEILHSNSDISPLLSDVEKKIKRFRECGLDDDKIREAVPAAYRIRQRDAKNGRLEKPNPEEIEVISMPAKYQKSNWE